MSPAARAHGDNVRLELEEFEVQLLRSLPPALRALLEGGDTEDPVLGRLFPPVSPDDADTDAEVRRLIYDDLLQERLESLTAFTEILEAARSRRGKTVLDLDAEQAQAALSVLNDLRLTLGMRVGITSLDRDEIDETHPAYPTLAVMDHLAWIQEELLSVLDPPSVGRG
ncbi:MAG: DUF2017 family protein [Nitriliruptorales bacterium]